jgi:hypothetical protein
MTPVRTRDRIQSNGPGPAPRAQVIPPASRQVAVEIKDVSGTVWRNAPPAFVYTCGSANAIEMAPG